MARLSDASGTYLELEPVAYHREDITPPPDAGRVLAHLGARDDHGGKIVRCTPNDDDANWLLVRMAASDGTRSWSATRAAFLTWELHHLVRWLRAIAGGAPDTDPWWACTDEPVDIRAVRTPTGIHLTLALGDWTWPEGAVLFVPADLDLPDDNDLNAENLDEEGYPRIHFAPDLSEEDQDTVRRRVRMMSRPVDRFRRATAHDDTAPPPDADPQAPNVLSPQDMESPILHFTLPPDTLLSFAHDLEAELRSFPVRVVEPNGAATRWLV